jgi:hypothetical protein
MFSIKKLYHRYIYGVMGTLIFHILLFSGFLIAEIDFKGNVREEAIIIDFSTVEEVKKMMEQTEKSKDQNTPSTQNEPGAAISNKAVNDARTKDDFFDKDYQNDVLAAQKLVQDVNQQLSKKITDINDFDMPEITTEGVAPDSVKNVIYSGKSNIHYYLENRYHLSMRNPVYLAKEGGILTVDIAVDRNGRVVKAEPRINTEIKDSMLPEYAKNAALRTIFNADQSAPKIQTGTITYTFVPQ